MQYFALTQRSQCSRSSDIVGGGETAAMNASRHTRVFRSCCLETRSIGTNESVRYTYLPNTHARARAVSAGNWSHSVANQPHLNRRDADISPGNTVIH